MSTKSIVVSSEEKIKFLKKHKQIAEDAFKHKECDMYIEFFTDFIREHFKYSLHTNKRDLFRSWRSAYYKMKGKIL